MNNIESNKGEIVMYQPDETIRLEVRVENETVWLNRQQMASLFGRDVKTIGKHINNALKEELANVPTVANFAIVQIEGGRTVNRTIEFYNLDMILSVGYRVKSSRGVKFRRWSNGILKQYLLKGYAVNARINLILGVALECIVRHFYGIGIIMESVVLILQPFPFFFIIHNYRYFDFLWYFCPLNIFC